MPSVRQLARACDSGSAHRRNRSRPAQAQATCPRGLPEALCASLRHRCRAIADSARAQHAPAHAPDTNPPATPSESGQVLVQHHPARLTATGAVLPAPSGLASGRPGVPRSRLWQIPRDKEPDTSPRGRHTAPSRYIPEAETPTDRVDGPHERADSPGYQPPMQALTNRHERLGRSQDLLRPVGNVECWRSIIQVRVHSHQPVLHDLGRHALAQ